MTDVATLSHRIIDEIWNQKNVDAADQLISSDCVVHDPHSVHEGLDGYKQFVREYLNAFPDLHFTIEDQVADEHAMDCHGHTSRGTPGNSGDRPARNRERNSTQQGERRKIRRELE